MQATVLLLESLYPLMQLLAALITLVHLLREALELLDCLFGLSTQHKPEFFSLARKFFDVLLEASEAHLLGFGGIVREVLLDVENLRVKI